MWYGSWSAEHPDVAPNRFLALLEEQAWAVTGTIIEPDDEGSDDVHRALVGGERSGSSIAWVKQYDGSGRLAHSVRYSGSVNAEATEIRGHWQLESFAGSFTMQREKFDASELEEREELPEL